MRRAPENGVWIDATSYSQNNTDRTPRTWEIRLGGLQLTVTRHIHYPGSWIMKCEPFFSSKDLENIDVETAKTTALEMTKAELRIALDAVDKAIGS